MNNILNKLKFILTRDEKKKILTLSLGALILALLETFSVGIIIPIMYLFVNQQKIQGLKALQWFYQITGIKDDIIFLTVLIITAIILFVLKSFFTVFMLYKERNTINSIYIRLTTKLLTSYLHRQYSFHLVNNSAVLLKNLTIEVSHLCSSFLFSLVLVSSEGIILLALSCLFISLYPLITLLLAVLLAIVMAFITLFLNKRIKLYSSQRLETSEDVYKFGLEALQAVKEIKVYNAQDFFIERYSQRVKQHTDSQVKFNIASVLPRHILETVLCSSVLITLLISMYFHKAPSELIPMMTAFGMAALRVLPAIHRIFTNINVVKFYSNSCDIIYNILKEDGQEELLDDTVSGDIGMHGESQVIRLENVEFSYKTASFPILKDFNLVIPRDKTVGFAGETGAGKSTLIDILMGLLIPDSGALYYGSQAITYKNVSQYRKKIGYVPQHIFLIDNTIKANIAFGISQDKIDYGQLRHVIQISQLESFVNDLPAGIKTMVGEKGVKLSGGQRQRVGIARALYHNPEILIMDEATSALDGYTEAEVNKAIKNLCGKLTIILIAHRLSTIEYADIIYVMDRGKIVDQGSFKELLENSSAFQKIANKTTILEK